MTRQTERADARRQAKIDATTSKSAARQVAKRQLLERQTVREKAGAYTGRGVAASVAPSRSRLETRRIQKGKPFGRVILEFTEFGREWSLHTTKGWRSHRAA